MWIRSQDRTNLVDVNQVAIEGTKIICNKWTLGTYETKERVVEVLDKIERHINNYGYQNITGSHEGVAKVYTMPEK